MERKGLFLSVVLAIFFLFCFSVEARPLPEVSKKAKAEMLLSIKVSKESQGKVKSGQKVAYDYRFQIKFLNQGNRPLLWDNCLGLIICEQGDSLVLRMSMQAKPGEEKKRQGIGPGESLEFAFSTKGYTDKLVANRGKGKMFFAIALEQGGEAAFGPSGVFVPRLEELNPKEKERVLPLVEIQQSEVL